MIKKRDFGYGEKRTLSFIEKFAIRSRLKIVRQHIASKIKIRNEPINVLELGCGFHGSNLIALKKEFPSCNFTGVDISINQNIHNDINFIKADLDLWTPDKCYDVIFSLAVIEHLTNIEQHFRLIALSTNDASLAIITSPTPQAHIVLATLAWIGMIDQEEIEDHKLYLTRNGLCQGAFRAGLSVVEYKTFQISLNQVAILKKATCRHS